MHTSHITELIDDFPPAVHKPELKEHQGYHQASTNQLDTIKVLLTYLTFYTGIISLPPERVLSPIPPPAHRVNHLPSAIRKPFTASPSSGPPGCRRPRLSLLQLEPDKLFSSLSGSSVFLSFTTATCYYFSASFHASIRPGNQSLSSPALGQLDNDWP
ncbi:Hypothetical predicted protein [Scomber scombrus]|uniref:Uncharacterized protein n=1 Tax=Scomber scombrus TaxID=13677 RepID=A0AAV1MYK5_SCOSC